MGHLAAPAALLLLVAGLVCVHAATRAVVCCSFADVVTNITAARDNDTVVIASGTFTALATQVLPINVNRSVVVTGASANTTVLALRGKTGFINLNLAGNLTLMSMTIRDGRDNVLNTTSANASLTVNDVTFNNLTSSSLSFTSAALRIFLGKASFTQCRFLNSTFNTIYNSSMIRVSTGANLTISDTTFTTIKVVGGSAGVASVAGAMVTLTNTNFTYCTATGNGNILGSTGLMNLNGVGVDRCSMGLVVAVNTQSAIVWNGLSISNSKTLAGSPVSLASPNADLCGLVFTNNTAGVYYNASLTTATSFYAGAMQFRGGLTLSDSSFTNNTGGFWGGGIYANFTSPSTICDTTFTNNKGTFSGNCTGGAINVAAGALSVVGCTFSSNSAVSAGAIDHSTGVGSLVVQGSYFNANTANALGTAGAIRTGINTTLVIAGSSFYKNVAGEGGALDVSTPISIMGSSFVNHTATLRAGVITMVSPASLYACNSTFSNNLVTSGSATKYGGVLLTDMGRVVFSGCTISNNYAYRGAVMYGVTSLEVYGSTLNGNSATENSAILGAISTTISLNVTLQDSTFANNSGDGGLIFGQTFAALINRISVTRCTITGTQSSQYGTVFSYVKILSVLGSTFSYNRPIGSTGPTGMFYTPLSQTQYINGSTFIGNTAPYSGIFYNNVVFAVDSMFIGNNCTSPAGCGAVGYQLTPSFTNCTFSGNRNTILSSWAAATTIAGCTFTGNSIAGPTNYAAVAYQPNNYPIMFKNCTFSGNTGPLVRTTNSGASPQFHNSTFSGNTATLAMYSSVGILNLQSATTIVGCTFTSHSSYYATVYMNTYTISVTGSVFIGSTGSNNGGAIGTIGGVVQVTDSYFANCVASSGGAVYSSSTTSITGSTFVANTATAGIGGGAFASTGNIRGCTFDSNVVLTNNQKGGGLYSSNSITVSDTTFVHNSAYTGGGYYACSVATVVNGRFLSNTAGGDNGGGFFAQSTTTLRNTMFSGNSAIYGKGGAIYTYSVTTSLCMTNSSCDGDKANSGGCIASLGYLSVAGSSMTATNANLGGAIFMIYPQATITNTTIRATTAVSVGQSGGAVYAAYTGTVTGVISFQRVTITGCRASVGIGGAVSILPTSGAVNFTSCSLTNNYAATDGGAVAISTSTNVTFASTVLSGNEAVGKGGAIYSLSGVVKMNATTVTGNLASMGGGIYAQTGSYAIQTGSSITCNTATVVGDSIACLNSSASVATDVQIASSGSGPGPDDVYCYGCTGDCVGCGQCNGGCRQSGGPLGCYRTPTACTSCPIGFIGTNCDVVNGTSCRENLACPERPIGGWCIPSCNLNASIVNPAINLTAIGNLTCVTAAGWAYANACIPCPDHHFGLNCSETEVPDCEELDGTGVLTGCPAGYTDDTCIPYCNGSLHYERNPALLLPVRCQSGIWNASAELCTIIPPNCPPIPDDTDGVETGCIGGYLGDLCTPTCGLNFTMDGAYAFSLPLACGAVGGWTPGPALCQPCPPGFFGQNCTERFSGFCGDADLTDAVPLPTYCPARVGDTCGFACTGDNINTTSLSITCLGSGQWSSPVVCTDCGGYCQTCSAVGVCTSCQPGHTSLPTCGVDVICGPLPNKANYTTDCTEITTVPYLSTCTITCVTDETMNTTIYCVDLFKWSAINMVCPPAPPPPCPPPTPPPPPAEGTPPPPPPVVSGAPPTAAPPTSPPAAASTSTGGNDAVVTGVSPPASGGSSAIIGVVVAICVILLIVIGVLLMLQRRKRDRNGVPVSGDSTVRVDAGAKKRVEKMIKGAPVLGRGMTAIVYKAQMEDGTPVAVKVATGTTEAASVEFHREAHFMGQLMGRVHQHVIGMKFYCDDPRAIIMELAERGSVRALLSDGRPKDALEIVKQTCEGLQVLHEHNIAHLDMKPENILIGADGCYKLSDFGCAVSCAPDAEPVRSNTFVGTPQYSSPERFLIGIINPKAADIYGLALTIWSIYEATTPLAKETYDTILTKCSTDVTFPLKELSMAPDTPSEVVRAVVWGIKREIHLRATIAQMREVLDPDDTANALASGNPVFDSNGSGGMNSGGRVSLFQVDKDGSSPSNSAHGSTKSAHNSITNTNNGSINGTLNSQANTANGGNRTPPEHGSGGSVQIAPPPELDTVVTDMMSKDLATVKSQ